MKNGRIRIDKDRAALLVVDIQPDFLPGGALAVPRAKEILPPLRKLMNSNHFGLIVATQDWHPRDHISFASNHAGRRPMDTIDLYGHQQTLWPNHCVQGTPGAELHRGLPWFESYRDRQKGHRSRHRLVQRVSQQLGLTRKSAVDGARRLSERSWRRGCLHVRSRARLLRQMERGRRAR